MKPYTEYKVYFGTGRKGNPLSILEVGDFLYRQYIGTIFESFTLTVDVGYFNGVYEQVVVLTVLDEDPSEEGLGLLQECARVYCETFDYGTVTITRKDILLERVKGVSDG